LSLKRDNLEERKAKAAWFLVGSVSFIIPAERKVFVFHTDKNVLRGRFFLVVVAVVLISSKESVIRCK
jgi:hypothetical protein